MRRKEYTTPRMRTVKIAVSHLLTGSNPPPTQGQGSGYEWGDKG